MKAVKVETKNTNKLAKRSITIFSFHKDNNF